MATKTNQVLKDSKTSEKGKQYKLIPQIQRTTVATTNNCQQTGQILRNIQRKNQKETKSE